VTDTIDTTNPSNLLTEFELYAAYVTAALPTKKAAADKIGRSVGWLRDQELRPEFRIARSEAAREIAEKVVEEAADFGALFDSEIVNNFSTAVEIRDDEQAKGDTRLRAAFGLLDRAPSSPKIVKHVEREQRVVLQIPVQHLKALEMAAGDVQDAEIIGLLAGERHGEDGLDIEATKSVEAVEKAGSSATIEDDYVAGVVDLDEL